MATGRHRVVRADGAYHGTTLGALACMGRGLYRDDFAAVLADFPEVPFGDLAALKTAFVTEGIGHFGSGWVWLTADKSGALKIISTHDAECTLTLDGVTPLLVCDLWEHAYYLDHQNNRKGFLEAWFDSLANWSLAESQLAAAQGNGAVWAYPAPAK